MNKIVVIHMYGGVIQDIYCQDQNTKIVIVDEDEPINRVMELSMKMLNEYDTKKIRRLVGYDPNK